METYKTVESNSGKMVQNLCLMKSITWFSWRTVPF